MPVSKIARRSIKWTTSRVLAVARQRTRALVKSPEKVQRMLNDLMIESGWSDDDFADALCRDIFENGRRPTPNA